MEEYRAALKTGEQPNRQAFLARYPEVREALAGSSQAGASPEDSGDDGTQASGLWGIVPALPGKIPRLR